jgi:hypothetical protein
MPAFPAFTTLTLSTLVVATWNARIEVRHEPT